MQPTKNDVVSYMWTPIFHHALPPSTNLVFRGRRIWAYHLTDVDRKDLGPVGMWHIDDPSKTTIENIKFSVHYENAMLYLLTGKKPKP